MQQHPGPDSPGDEECRGISVRCPAAGNIGVATPDASPGGSYPCPGGPIAIPNVARRNYKELPAADKQLTFSIKDCEDNKADDFVVAGIKALDGLAARRYEG